MQYRARVIFDVRSEKLCWVNGFAGLARPQQSHHLRDPQILRNALA